MEKERKDQQPHAIRTEMGKVTTVSILAMTCLCLLLIAAEYFALSDMKEMIGKSNVYASYYSSCEQIHQSMLEYMSNHRAESKEKCMDALDAFTAFSEKVREEFDHPRFEDQYYLSLAYREDVEKFLEIGEENLSEGQLAAYTEAESIRDYLQYNSGDLNTIRNQLITKGSQEIFNRWKVQLIVFLGTAAFSSFFVWYKGRQMLKKILSPILHLTEQAKRIQKGDFQIEPIKSWQSGSQETLVLTNAFSDMAETIQTQMEELKEKVLLGKKLHALEIQNIQFQMQLTETKLQLMQSMVNPHFLFNCLNTLSSLAYLEHAEKTRDAAQMIAGYLRNSLSFVGKKISMREEIAHTRRYMEIQKLRFGERIQFLTVCDPDCEEMMVPGMILQPLAENAISHGLKTMAQNGHVKIEIKKDSETVNITVEDNGKGMTEEKMKGLREGFENPATWNQGGIGLQNVASRMKMIFGERFKIFIDSQAGKGTKIRLEVKTELTAQAGQREPQG